MVTIQFFCILKKKNNLKIVPIRLWFKYLQGLLNMPVRYLNKYDIFISRSVGFISSPELAQGELLGLLISRRPRPHLFVYTLAVTFLPQSSSNFVRMLA
jgi:hypothetical protein